MPNGSPYARDKNDLRLSIAVAIGAVIQLLPVWVGGDWGDTGAFGGGGCAINRGGASQDYCIAGLTVTHSFAPGVRLGAEVFHQTPDKQGGRHATILGAGATWDISETLHLLAYAGASVAMQPMVEELNALLAHSERQAEEARTHAGNLAHAHALGATILWCTFSVVNLP